MRSPSSRDVHQSKHDHVTEHPFAFLRALTMDIMEFDRFNIVKKGASCSVADILLLLQPLSVTILNGTAPSS